MIHLRPLQTQLEAEIYASWHQNNRNVLAVAPTGFGKTVLFSKILHDHRGAACAVAHRQELVSQTSMALARNGVRHGIIAPPAVCRVINRMHMDELGRSYYDPHSLKRVAGIDTLRNLDPADPWLQQVTLRIDDEAHHNLAENKWGKGTLMMPNAWGLGVTATPVRADGKGLGRHADGIYDSMVLGPSLREVINAGYVTDYRIICAQPTDLDLTDVPIGANGEFNYERVRDAVHKSSKIVGDIVSHYLRHARGMLGVTFAVDVDEAVKLAQAYRDAGVPAEVVTAKTPILMRAHIMREFKARRIHQLVNVDIFGEGSDLPAAQVISMGRPTQSFGLFSQQFGRMLRLMIPADLSDRWGDFTDTERRAYLAASDKPHGLLLDHVGNIFRHGVPDARERHLSWTLDRRERRGSSSPTDAEPLRVCSNPAPDAVRMTTIAAGGRTFMDLMHQYGEAEAMRAGFISGDRIPCGQPFSRFLSTCPHCGYKPEPAGRSSPEMVEGDLAELSPEALAALRGEIEQADSNFVAIPRGASFVIAASLNRKAQERREAQAILRATIAQWGGVHMAQGRSTSEQQRRFWHRFGVDVGTAQTLAAREAEDLRQRVQNDIDGFGNNPV